MKEVNANLRSEFIDEIKEIIFSSRFDALRSVDFHRVMMYWNIGRKIIEEEQSGSKRAEYGKYIIKSLSKDLTPEYGSGFSVRQLERCRQFYKEFPIASALRSQFTWTHYKLLISLSNDGKREYYIEESCKNNWNSRQLERQINSQLYERLLLSNDKERVLAVARGEKNPEDPADIIKDPMLLEFLGLKSEGVLLSTSKNDTVVKFTLPENNKTIKASQYELYLPNKEELQKQIKKTAKMFNNNWKETQNDHNK